MQRRWGIDRPRGKRDTWAELAGVLGLGRVWAGSKCLCFNGLILYPIVGSAAGSAAQFNSSVSAMPSHHLGKFGALACQGTADYTLLLCWALMRSSLALILVGLCQIGCASHSHGSHETRDAAARLAMTDTRGSQVPLFPAALTSWEWDELQSAPQVVDSSFTAGITSPEQEWAVASLPEHLMRKLQPVEVYRDHGSLVVALSRDAHYEWGYYVVKVVGPAVHDLGVGSIVWDARGWAFTSLRPEGILLASPSPSASWGALMGSRVYVYSRHR